MSLKRILCVGPQWRGSNAGGLFKALARQGVSVVVVDEFNHISLMAADTRLKVVHRLIRSWQIRDFNEAIAAQMKLFDPQVLLVYKGAFVLPSLLRQARERGIWLVNFYPDVSMFSHGKLLPQTMPLYDMVLTTKSFGPQDLREKFGVKNACYIPHGFDPDVHRALPMDAAQLAAYGCDASFIGTWSPKKEAWLSRVMELLPGLKLRIWGDQWHKNRSANLSDAIMGKAVLGDLYITAIQASAVNIAILSEQVQGASSGDQITSRTFHIPAAGGFMLHERNEESVRYYDAGNEAGFFEGPDELAEQIRYYLDNDAERERIRLNGMLRAQRDHSLDTRAEQVLQILNRQQAADVNTKAGSVSS